MTVIAISLYDTLIRMQLAFSLYVHWRTWLPRLHTIHDDVPSHSRNEGSK